MMLKVEVWEEERRRAEGWISVGQERGCKSGLDWEKRSDLVWQAHGR